MPYNHHEQQRCSPGENGGIVPKHLCNESARKELNQAASQSPSFHFLRCNRWLEVVEERRRTVCLPSVSYRFFSRQLNEALVQFRNFLGSTPAGTASALRPQPGRKSKKKNGKKGKQWRSGWPRITADSLSNSLSVCCHLRQR